MTVTWDSSISADQAAETARRVLSHPKYGEIDQGRSMFGRALDWVAELISDLFRTLTSAGPRGLLVWVVIAILAGLVGYTLFKLWWAAGTTRVDTIANQAQIDITENLSADQWRRRAAAAEAEGDWREAIRAHHRALVVDLVDRDALQVVPGMTAGEIARRVGATHPAAGPDLDALTDLFKNVYFGAEPAGPDHSRSIQHLAERVLAGVGSAQPAMAE